MLTRTCVIPSCTGIQCALQKTKENQSCADISENVTFSYFTSSWADVPLTSKATRFVTLSKVLNSWTCARDLGVERKEENKHHRCHKLFICLFFFPELPVHYVSTQLSLISSQPFSFESWKWIISQSILWTSTETRNLLCESIGLERCL